MPRAVVDDGNLLTELLGLVVVGLIVGAIGRLLVPGPNPSAAWAPSPPA
jgi:hypothetical protein